MPNPSQKSALKQGYITQKQYDKLPTKMLDGIIKHNKAKGKKPGHKGKKHGAK
jgi:hypothetical protein